MVPFDREKERDEVLKERLGNKRVLRINLENKISNVRGRRRLE